jgi:hypothetical protein
MNSIISQTKETISVKKKKIAENTQFINGCIMELNDKVKWNYELQNDIENLERDLSSLEKQRPSSAIMDHGCSTNAKDALQMLKAFFSND